MSETPIFDALLREQGVDEMPLPPLKTHKDFMHERAHDVWLERAKMILAGEMDPSYYDDETKDPLTKPIPITKAKPKPPRKKP